MHISHLSVSVQNKQQQGEVGWSDGLASVAGDIQTQIKKRKWKIPQITKEKSTVDEY